MVVQVEARLPPPAERYPLRVLHALRGHLYGDRGFRGNSQVGEGGGGGRGGGISGSGGGQEGTERGAGARGVLSFEGSAAAGSLGATTATVQEPNRRI